MLEVPALVWQLPALARAADFVSVGSNDLLQFLFASDRGNPRLSQRYDALSPSVLSLLRNVVETCDAAEVPLTLCGEMAGAPLEAMALVGIGFRSLSLSAPAYGPVKEMIRSLDVGGLSTYIGQLAGGTDHTVRHKLSDFARDHEIVI